MTSQDCPGRGKAAGTFAGRRRRAGLAAIVALPLLLWLPARAEAGTQNVGASEGQVTADSVRAQLVSHQALYDISLLRSAGGAVRDVRGALSIDWQKMCDGYTLLHRIALEVLREDGIRLQDSWTLAAWESLNGLKYRFTTRISHNDDPVRTLRGDAIVEERGGKGEAVFSLPESRSIALSGESWLPTAHMIEMIRRLENGEKMFYGTLFDGTEVNSGLKINSLLLKTMQPRDFSPLEGAAGDTDLLDEPGWKLQLTAWSEEAEPEHEQVLELMKNGVVRTMVLDFGDLRIRAALKRITGLEQSTACNAE